MPDIVDLTDSGDEATPATTPTVKMNQIRTTTKQPLPPFHTRVMAIVDLTGTDDDDCMPPAIPDLPPAIPDLAAAKLHPATKLRPAPKCAPAKKKIQAKLKVLSVTVSRPSNFASLVVRSDSAERKHAAREKCPAQEDPSSSTLMPMPFASSASVLLGTDRVANPVAGEGSYWILLRLIHTFSHRMVIFDLNSHFRPI
jgi:hypothetical protein